jgi:hypothetical protein
LPENASGATPLQSGNLNNRAAKRNWLVILIVDVHHGISHIFPVPCEFISPDLPHCAVIRPTSPGQIDAVGAINGLISDGLFIGQTPEFSELVLNLAHEADAATRS